MKRRNIQMTFCCVIDVHIRGTTLLERSLRKKTFPLDECWLRGETPNRICILPPAGCSLGAGTPPYSSRSSHFLQQCLLQFAYRILLLYLDNVKTFVPDFFIFSFLHKSDKAAPILLLKSTTVQAKPPYFPDSTGANVYILPVRLIHGAGRRWGSAWRP